MKKGAAILTMAAAAVVSLLIVENLEPPESTRLWKAFFDSGHALLFGLLAVAVLVASHYILPGSWPRRRHYIAALAVSTGVGLYAEVEQIYGPRSADIVDLVLNVLGSVSFLLYASTFDRHLAPRRLRTHNVLRALAVFGLIAAYFPVIVLGIAQAQRSVAFPRICDFRSRLERPLSEFRRVEVTVRTLPEEWAEAPGQQATHVTFHAARYPRVAMEETYPNWTGYDRLVFTLYSVSGESAELHLRIEDALHNQRSDDRFDRTLEIHPGINHFEIPLSEIHEGLSRRKMDMTRIRRLVLYGYRLSSPVSVYIDAFRLEERTISLNKEARRHYPGTVIRQWYTIDQVDGLTFPGSPTRIGR